MRCAEASMGLLTDTHAQAPNAEKDVYTSCIVPHYTHQLARARSQERARVSQTEACGTCPQSIFLIDISAPGAERRGSADSHTQSIGLKQLLERRQLQRHKPPARGVPFNRTSGEVKSSL
jgi:hypothetical protein